MSFPLRLPSATDFLTIAEESQQRTLGKTELDPSNSVLPGLPHRVIPNFLVNLLLEVEEIDLSLGPVPKVFTLSQARAPVGACLASQIDFSPTVGFSLN